MGPTSFNLDLPNYSLTPGDLIHMDRHGAVIIPEAVADKIPAACDLLARKEAVILDLARQPGFTVAKLTEALKKQDEIH